MLLFADSNWSFVLFVFFVFVYNKANSEAIFVSDKYDVAFWFGDFNYRINGTRKIVDILLQKNKHEVIFLFPYFSFRFFFCVEYKIKQNKKNLNGRVILFVCSLFFFVSRCYWTMINLLSKESLEMFSRILKKVQLILGQHTSTITTLIPMILLKSSVFPRGLIEFSTNRSHIVNLLFFWQYWRESQPYVNPCGFCCCC